MKIYAEKGRWTRVRVIDTLGLNTSELVMGISSLTELHGIAFNMQL